MENHVLRDVKHSISFVNIAVEGWKDIFTSPSNHFSFIFSMLSHEWKQWMGKSQNLWEIYR